MRTLIIGDPHGKLPKRIPENLDLILITGDLGKADLARERFFENIERKKKGLLELEKTPVFEKKILQEIASSSLNVVKYFSDIAPTYSILGNVGASTDSEIKKEEKKLGMKLPYIRSELESIKNFNIVINRVRRINGLRFGFLDYFVDNCWIKEFNIKDEKLVKEAQRETARAEKILQWFGNLDVLVCHQPPYRVLDEISEKYGAPKSWWGKHAGSKVILDYIKKKQPRYVFCGHIHEGKGREKIRETEVYNVGSNGDYVLIDLD